MITREMTAEEISALVQQVKQRETPELFAFIQQIRLQREKQTHQQNKERSTQKAKRQAESDNTNRIAQLAFRKKHPHSTLFFTRENISIPEQVSRETTPTHATLSSK